MITSLENEYKYFLIGNLGNLFDATTTYIGINIFNLSEGNSFLNSLINFNVYIAYALKVLVTGFVFFFLFLYKKDDKAGRYLGIGLIITLFMISFWNIFNIFLALHS